MTTPANQIKINEKIQGKIDWTRAQREPSGTEGVASATGHATAGAVFQHRTERRNTRKTKIK
jgi:hypothetical protein